VIAAGGKHDRDGAELRVDSFDALGARLADTAGYRSRALAHARPR
jgi:hypothetical protein